MMQHSIIFAQRFNINSLIHTHLHVRTSHSKAHKTASIILYSASIQFRIGSRMSAAYQCMILCKYSSTAFCALFINIVTMQEYLQRALECMGMEHWEGTSHCFNWWYQTLDYSGKEEGEEARSMESSDLRRLSAPRPLADHTAAISCPPRAVAPTAAAVASGAVGHG